jgi:hypothetical protein
MEGVPVDHAGAASGLLQMDQLIGGALGSVVITEIYTLAVEPGRYVSGLPAAFGAGAAIAFLAAVIAWHAFRPRTAMRPVAEYPIAKTS